MKTIVVNIRSDEYDVYIGRAGHGREGYFGNPFIIGPDGRRPEVLKKYREYFHRRVEQDLDFRLNVLTLKGKRLGCFCAPAACHGDVIARWLDAPRCTVCHVTEVDAAGGYDTCCECEEQS